MPTSSDFVRVGLAARYLGVKPITVHRWIWWGWLKGYRFGPQLKKVRASDVKKLKKLAEEMEDDVACQADTRYGSILRDSRKHFGTHPLT